MGEILFKNGDKLAVPDSILNDLYKTGIIGWIWIIKENNAIYLFNMSEVVYITANDRRIDKRWLAMEIANKIGKLPEVKTKYYYNLVEALEEILKHYKISY